VKARLAALLTALAGGVVACDAADQRGDELAPVVGACPDAAAFFEERVWRPMLSQRCIACHTEGGLAGHTRLLLWDESRPGWLEHDFTVAARLALENIDGTPLLLLKPSGLDPRGHTGGTLVPAGTELYADLSTFAAMVAGDCAEAPTVCDPEAPPRGPRLLRRLDHAELANTLRDLLGVDPTPFVQNLAPDEVVDGYANNAEALTVTGLLADQYREVAEAIAAEAVATRLDALVSCGPGARDRACALRFIAELGLRAFRRPLSEADLAGYLAVYDLAAEDGFDVGVTWVLTAMLQSPHFLYRSELGVRTSDADEGAEDAGATWVLTDWEIATALSYLFWSTTPDQALLDAAAAGELSTAAGFCEQVARLSADPRAEATMARFTTQWLGLGRLPHVARDAELYADLTPEVRAAMAGEVDHLVSDAYASGATLADLLLGRTTWLDQDLAGYYGVSSAGAGGFAPVDVSGTPYGGLLRTGALLTVHALPTGSSPIHRGKLVRDRLLCEDLEPPPPGLVADPPAADPTKSTRERYAAHAADEACASCHRYMDPIGFGFEHFDGAGRWRERDGLHGIDDSGVVNAMPGAGDVAFDGVEGLTEVLAGADITARCYLRQWVRFGTGVRDDPCQVDALWASWQDGGGTLAGPQRVIARSPAFTHRRGGADEQDTLAFGAVIVPDDPPILTEPPAAGAGEVSVSVEETATWGTGYCRQAEVTNPGDADVTWEVVLEAPGSFTTVWNATPEEALGGWRFRGVDWNATLSPGATTNFGWCAEL